MTPQKPCIALAAGGTGGHLFPAEAVAQALLARGCQVVLYTDSRVSDLHKRFSGIDIRIVASGTTTGRTLPARLTNITKAFIGLFQSFQGLRHTRPNVIVGFGGYPSLPPMIAASLLGIPLILHEQNTICGKANRFLATRARLIATGFPDCQKLPAGTKAETRHVGNPVRSAVLLASETRKGRTPSANQINILVTGGSQGASFFSDIMPKSLLNLSAEQRKNIKIWHQVRNENIVNLRSAYDALEIDAICSPFFENLPELMGDADLVITRAGALTTTELAIIGVPAILVPLPSSADGHQIANAKLLESVGGGWAIMQDALSSDSLSGIIVQTLETKLENINTANALSLVKTQAAQDFSEIIIQYVKNIQKGEKK